MGEFDKILNFSKKRKFVENMYDIYRMSKEELGKYYKIWMREPNHLMDKVWSVIKVDEDTSYHLYGRRINPISFNLMEDIYQRAEIKRLKKAKKKDRKPLPPIKYHLFARIHSIDDSSFGIWFTDTDKCKLKRIRVELMKWVNSQNLINGEKFLDYCLELGAKEDSKDYN